ncbi:hypothetical protein ANANG_G00293550 [Anguilla anguilla]|uniref:Uncharacterized protein n=1 Tax=Anguilla anguilla TaxID=7936 RepID=A0A9D3RJR6_ANGAN|nr:hypothetical protein ANANG_G00293550 [Anguilla anguilla]
MEAETPPATAQPEREAGQPEADRKKKKKKKKKKKRKREEEEGECPRSPGEMAQSHLEPPAPPHPSQEEDWCLGEPWTISPAPARAQTQLEQTQTQPEQTQTQTQTPNAGQQAADAVRKKKRKRKDRQEEETVSYPAPEGSGMEGGDTGTELKKKKKKKRRLKEHLERCGEKGQRASDREHTDAGAVLPPQGGAVEAGKAPVSSSAAVFVWDSRVRDGYRRLQADPAAEEGGGRAPRPAATGWDGARTGGVVEELLRNSADTAYGTQVLSWDGDVSAISRDAAEDARLSKMDTVIDEWDEDFDSGKVKKVKKREEGLPGIPLLTKRTSWHVGCFKTRVVLCGSPLEGEGPCRRLALLSAQSDQNVAGGRSCGPDHGAVTSPRGPRPPLRFSAGGGNERNRTSPTHGRLDPG